jgi:LysM repeat protein
MKKLAYLGAVIGIIALAVFLVYGTTMAQEPGIPGEPEPEPEPNIDDIDVEDLPKPVEGEAGQAAVAEGTAARIDFEFTDQAAREGTYVIKEKGGRTLATWYALDGWQDSGWISNLDISHDAVHVEVLYYPSTGAEPTAMKILNPAGGTEYGWLANGVEHALEVGFPDAPPVVAPHTSVPTVAQTGGPYVVSSASTVPVVVPTTVTGTAGEQVYVVQSGNNLFRIGLHYGCSYLDLAAYNGIPNPDLIYAGQVIRIPASCGK